MSTPRSAAITDADDASRTMDTAFRELHGRHLHGFALLVTLGNRPLAARLAADAIAAADARRDELRHPERAAAWLRARIVDSVPRHLREPTPVEQRVALEPLGLDAAMADGLAALGIRERAALVAADVERLDRRDVEVATGRSAGALERLLLRARRRYADAVAANLGSVAHEPPGSDGPIVTRIRAVARRAMT